MKQIKIVRVLALTLLLTLSLTACGNDDPAALSQKARNQAASAASFQVSQVSSFPENISSQSAPEVTPTRAKVVTCNQGEDGRWSLLVTEESGLSFLSCFEVDEAAGTLAPGAIIDISGVTSVLCSYPGQLTGENITVTVIEQGEDLIGLYRSILNYIYEEDSGLNPNEEQLKFGSGFHFGFDFTEVHNLTQDEKGALAYLFSCDHGIAEYVFGTYRELAEKGYIDEEALYWEDGLLFTISDEESSGNSFTCSVSKWKGGLGAVGHDDCTARKTADGWIFDEPSSTWIA